MLVIMRVAPSVGFRRLAYTDGRTILREIAGLGWESVRLGRHDAAVLEDQLSFLSAREARDLALVQVERGMDGKWRAEAKRALWTRIQAGGEFTTDELQCPSPREPRAWGPIILAAAKSGLIVNTGKTRQSSNPTCHARPKTIWRVTL